MTSEHLHTPKPSNELVPLTYARAAYNALYGASLEAHGDHLTKEQAAAINDHFDIQVYLGTHGDVSESPFVAPTKAEYEAAESVVQSMELGDVLFVEGYGFKEQYSERQPIDEQTTTMLGALTFVATGFTPEGLNQLKLRQLEQQRREYQINAWEYARKLAYLQGLQVVHADMDAADTYSFAMPLDRLRQLGTSGGDPTDQAYADRIHDQREHRAVNILKDWALQHLPEGAVGERKPKLVLLFGAGHHEGFEDKLRQLGLEADVHFMVQSEFGKRVVEHAVRTTGSVLQRVSSHLNTKLGKHLENQQPTTSVDRYLRRRSTRFARRPKLSTKARVEQGKGTQDRRHNGTIES